MTLLPLTVLSGMNSNYLHCLNRKLRALSLSMKRQLSFLKQEQCLKSGGKRSHEKRARVLCTKRPMHLILKSSKAHGAKSFFKYKNEIKSLLQKQAIKFGVTVYSYSNNGNHLHFALKISKRELFKNFLRAVTGLIARLVLRAEKTRAKLKSNERFWDILPFTRIAAWGKAYENLKSYVTLNSLEALGFVKHQTRDRKRKPLIRISIEPFEMRY